MVVKARRLSGSRGVIRADDSAALVRAVNWVHAIQSRADRDAQELGLVIEDFIPGREYALEGILDRGELTTLALFDKPDPLDGPYFEETIYVTPSRLPGELQEGIHHDGGARMPRGRARHRAGARRSASQRRKASGCWRSRPARSGACAAGCSPMPGHEPGGADPAPVGGQAVSEQNRSPLPAKAAPRGS